MESPFERRKIPVISDFMQEISLFYYKKSTEMKFCI